MSWVLLLIPVPYALLLLARHTGVLGRAGAAVRRSDAWALEEEIRRAEQRVSELKGLRR